MSTPITIISGQKNVLQPGGDYVLANPGVVVGSNTQIISADPTKPFPKLNCPPTSDGWSIHCNSDNFLCQGIESSGGGILFDKATGLNNNIQILGNIFHGNVPNGVTKDCIAASSGLSNSVIQDNVFDVQNGSFGVWVQNCQKLDISYNSFGICGCMVYMYGGSRDLTIKQNYLHDIINMGLQIQTFDSLTSPLPNILITQNWYENPQLAKATSNSFAFSIPTTWGQTTTSENICLAGAKPNPPGASSGPFVRMNFELGGKGMLAEYNYSDGGNDFAVTGSAATGNVRNNLIKNIDHFGGNANGAKTVWTNNGPTPWAASDARGQDMLSRVATRLIPGPFKRLYGTPTPIPPIPPDPTPIPLPLLNYKVVVNPNTGAATIAPM